MSHTMAPAPGLAVSCPHAALRADLRVYPPRPGDADRRYTVYDPRNDVSCGLSPAQWHVARLFNGERSSDDVCALLAVGSRPVTCEMVAGLERRLRQLGLVTLAGESAPRLRDPAAGISYGPLKQALSISLWRFAPEALLDTTFQRAPWLCSAAFVRAGLLAIAAALGWVVWRAGAFASDVGEVYSRDWHWLLWHYPVIVASICVHELGHAMACRRYRVRVTDFGVAIYLLLATGWARPLQRDWSALPRRARLVTIAMGPFASLLFGAAGVGLWAVAAPNGALRTLGIVMAVSSTAALVPTLLPIFNGDSYLAITEYFGVPRLRQRAFRHVRDRLTGRRGTERPTTPRAALYWATAFGTAAGWLAAWTWTVSTLLRLPAWH